MDTKSDFTPSRSSERGNMLFMILLAVALIGLLTAAIMQGSNNENITIDDETLAIRATEVQRAASEFERAVMFILSNKNSESDIRFAHAKADVAYGDVTDNPQRQVFHAQGGGATYRLPPADINDGSRWQFSGTTAAPGAGSARADLLAVLPNVTKQFCNKINMLAGQPATTPEDSGATDANGGSPGDCVAVGSSDGFFTDTYQFFSAPNTMVEATFAQDVVTSSARAALHACVVCDNGTYNFYHVLLAR